VGRRCGRPAHSRQPPAALPGDSPPPILVTC
jgi:hypothetical protein